MAALIGTWSFSLDAINIGKSLLLEGYSALDVVEKAISVIEDDAGYGLYQVGRGGYPNSDGQLECDAALMDGKEFKFGAVAALRGVATPIRVARHVMDYSVHSMLVGDGAAKFAAKQGFILEENPNLVGKHEEKECCTLSGQTQDTLGLIARDKYGNLAVGVSTSGARLKNAGRVGDSPLPGCGLYADNNAGAACTTGDGDELLKYCPSYEAVRLMANGLSAKEACIKVVNDIASRRNNKQIEMGIVAMNKQGEVGAAGSVLEWEDVRTSIKYPGFPYGVWSEGEFPLETILTYP